MTLDNLEISSLEIDPELGRTEAEFIFLGTCSDIIEKLKRGSRYDLIRTSGLLRHLLADINRLLDAAKRNHKLKIKFHDARIPAEDLAVLADYMRQTGGFVVVTPDSRLLDPINSRVSIDRFLSTPVTYHADRESLTIADYIDTVAHVFGGVHTALPNKRHREAVIDFNAVLLKDGVDPALSAIRGIAIATLDAVTPLVKAIQDAGRITPKQQKQINWVIAY